MKLFEKWSGESYWKKGVLIGFLFIPVLFLLGKFLIMPIFAMFGQETLAGIFDGLAMLTIVPAFFILKRFGNIRGVSSFNTMFLISIIIWTFIGAVIGYLVDKRKERTKGDKG